MPTDFVVIRYWDKYCTALLLDASRAGNWARGNNAVLARHAEASDKGKHSSVLVGSRFADDTHYGVLEHKLGHCPISLSLIHI